MRMPLILLFSLLTFFATLNAQKFNKAVNDAYLITRMAEKFHFQPKPLNDEFSRNIFIQILKQLDNDKIFFTIEDINSLSKFMLDIDDEIKNRQSIFLETLTTICSKRLIKIDTMINNICKAPFNFTLPGKITADDTSYAADEKQLRDRLYKFIKATALDDIMDDERLFKFSSSAQKKYIDSIEPSIRHKVQISFRHSVDVNFESESGINEALGNEYCKAIAACYDPHTEYFPPTEKENFESLLGRQPMTFGFEFKEDDDGFVKVENVLPGSPAFKSGQINKEDKIKSIQWGNQTVIDVSDGGLKKLEDVLRMSNHDKATFKIEKPDGTERTVILYKEKDDDDDDDNKVKSFVLKGSKIIGFISLPAFYQDWENENTGLNGCANDVAKEILKLKKENIEGLILDLRYNGGGSVQEAVELAGLFIDVGPVGEIKSRDAKTFTLKDVNRGTIFDGPLMLLVNGYTASASELVAGTLQDYNRAVIVGSTTYGKATSQVVLPMDTTIDLDKDFSNIKADSYIKLTVSELYRVNGNTAQAKGIQPDILLPDILDANPQREADEPNVLVSLPLQPNKYFRPGPPIAIDNLKAVAKTKADASPFFIELKKYIETEKNSRANNETSLLLADAMQETREYQLLTDTSLLEKEKPAYTVENNFYEKLQMQNNENLKEMNAQWGKFLSKDPYLHLAYDLIVLMK